MNKEQIKNERNYESTFILYLVFNTSWMYAKLMSNYVKIMGEFSAIEIAKNV